MCPLQIINDIEPLTHPLWCKHMLYPTSIKMKNYSIGHKFETTQPKKMLQLVTYFYTFVHILGSKFKILSATEILDFLILANKH